MSNISKTALVIWSAGALMTSCVDFSEHRVWRRRTTDPGWPLRARRAAPDAHRDHSSEVQRPQIDFEIDPARSSDPKLILKSISRRSTTANRFQNRSCEVQRPQERF